MNWEAVEKTVANVSVVLRNADKSEELLTLLEQAEKSCTVPTLKGMLLRFVLRYSIIPSDDNLDKTVVTADYQISDGAVAQRGVEGWRFKGIPLERDSRYPGPGARGPIR